MGARVECRDGRLPPLTVAGIAAAGHPLRASRGERAGEVVCAARRTACARARPPWSRTCRSRDHTERMLRHAGVRGRGRTRGAVSVAGADRLALESVDVPGDFSSAAFHLVGGSARRRLGRRAARSRRQPDAHRAAGRDERMGAAVERHEERRLSGEPVADLAVRGARLSATTVDAGEVPLMIDELPLVALLGALAEGTTRVRGAQELRHKESDRIATVVDGMRALGAEIEATGTASRSRAAAGFRGGTIDSHGDHRLAMLGAVAGLARPTESRCVGFEAAAVSYPGFAATLGAASWPRRGRFTSACRGGDATARGGGLTAGRAGADLPPPPPGRAGVAGVADPAAPLGGLAIGGGGGGADRRERRPASCRAVGARSCRATGSSPLRRAPARRARRARDRHARRRRPQAADAGGAY